MTSIGSPGAEAVSPPPEASGGGRAFEGFEAFAARERGALLAFAWSLTGDRGASEDIVQETLEAAWRDWRRVGDYDKPGAWARRVVANRATDRGRRRGRERRALERFHLRAGGDVELEPADAEFWGALRRLPARQAQALALHYLEDRPLAEIATILEMAEG